MAEVVFRQSLIARVSSIGHSGRGATDRWRNGYWLALLVFVVMVLICGRLPAQNLAQGRIAGKITDAETEEPLSDAIVFLSGTSIGASTDREGKYLLANIPPGTYEIVCARVGYARDKSTATIESGEFLVASFALRPQAIRTGEVEIVGKAGVAPENGPIFVPQDAPDSYCLYQSWSSVPIGILFFDSATFIYSLDAVVLEEKNYLRAWVLFRNSSGRPYDFDPIQSVDVIKGAALNAESSVRAEQPWLMLAKLSNGDVADDIGRRIGNELVRSGSKQQLVEDRNSRMRVPGTKEMNFEWGSSRSMLNPAVLAEAYTSSINDGLLKHHLVYPAASVHGYLYFLLSGSGESSVGRSGNNRYHVRFNAAGVSRTVEFVGH